MTPLPMTNDEYLGPADDLRRIIDKLGDERQLSYGDSWRWMSAIMQEAYPNIKHITMVGYFHPWYMILTKLMRLLKSPGHMDSWRDIIGYAQLVLDDLKEAERSYVPGK